VWRFCVAFVYVQRPENCISFNTLMGALIFFCYGGVSVTIPPPHSYAHIHTYAQTCRHTYKYHHNSLVGFFFSGSQDEANQRYTSYTTHAFMHTLVIKWKVRQYVPLFLSSFQDSSSSPDNVLTVVLVVSHFVPCTHIPFTPPHSVPTSHPARTYKQHVYTHVYELFSCHVLTQSLFALVRFHLSSSLYIAHNVSSDICTCFLPPFLSVSSACAFKNMYAAFWC
jgi:hypothetical protein